MAYFEKRGNFEVVNATSLEGANIAIQVRHSEELVAMMMRNKRPVVIDKKSVRHIVDVSGAADGAGSLVRMQWNHIIEKRNYESVRVKENPDELLHIFNRANIPAPEVKKSIGRRTRDVLKALNIY